MNKTQNNKSEPKADVIILAAGYATRLYPLTLTRPKPLLLIAGKPIIEYIIELLPKDTKKIHMVINEKFAAEFEAWKKSYKIPIDAEIIFHNDGSKDESDKLGAIGDLHFVLTRANFDKDILVVAGDNAFTEPFDEFCSFAREKSAPIIASYDVGSLEEAKKYSTPIVDSNGKLTFFEEKPPVPKTSLVGIALYYYPKSSLDFIHQYVKEGNNPDQPGRLIQWLYTRTDVYTWPLKGAWFDIGTKETLKAAEEFFNRLKAQK